MLAFGYAFLYMPIAILIVYSFNDSRLVTVWVRASTRWYGELFRNAQIGDACGCRCALPRPAPPRRWCLARWRLSRWTGSVVSAAAAPSRR